MNNFKCATKESFMKEIEVAIDALLLSALKVAMPDEIIKDFKEALLCTASSSFDTGSMFGKYECMVLLGAHIKEIAEATNEEAD